MQRRSLIAAAAVLTLAATGSAFAQQIELKLGHVGEPGSLFQISSDEFARRANEKLGGKAKVVVYGSSQLGGDKEMIQKLKLGTIDFALPSTVMTSSALISRWPRRVKNSWLSRARLAPSVSPPSG